MKVSQFCTIYNCRDIKKDIKSNVGCPLSYGYKYYHADNGERYLGVNPDDVTDVYEMIQMHVPDTDIYKMYERYLNGDITALDKNRGWYTDISEIPHTLKEFQALFDDQESKFGGLPVEFKEIFHNDYRQYAKSIASGQIEQIIQDFHKKYDRDYQKIDPGHKPVEPVEPVEDNKEVK